MKLNKIAIGVALAAGAMGTAQATELFFPYVVRSATVTTLVSVIDTNTATSYAVDNRLQWRLWYKDGANATNNAANCQEVNVFLPSSPNDIQTVDLGGQFGAATRGVLFNDPSVNNNWNVGNTRYDLAALATQPVRGWLLIDDSTVGVNGAEATNSNTGTLEGEALVFEFAGGAAWGYHAWAVESTQGSAADFASHSSAYPIGPSAGVNVAVMPWAEVITRFFVTPIKPNMFLGNNNDNPASGPADAVRLTFGQVGQTAMFDRDEGPVSGNVNQDVVCVGAVDAEQLISNAARNLIPDGGWGQLNVTLRGTSGHGTAGTPVTGASVLKLEYNRGATLNGQAVTGTFNNAFQLF